jgi:hypothetical protein
MFLRNYGNHRQEYMASQHTRPLSTACRWLYTLTDTPPCNLMQFSADFTCYRGKLGTSLAMTCRRHTNPDVQNLQLSNSTSPAIAFIETVCLQTRTSTCTFTVHSTANLLYKFTYTYWHFVGILFRIQKVTDWNLNPEIGCRDLRRRCFRQGYRQMPV